MRAALRECSNCELKMFRSGNLVNHMDSRLLAMLLLVWRFLSGCVLGGVRILSMFAGHGLDRIGKFWNRSLVTLRFLAVRRFNYSVSCVGSEILAKLWPDVSGLMTALTMPRFWLCELSLFCPYSLTLSVDRWHRDGSHDGFPFRRCVGLQA